METCLATCYPATVVLPLLRACNLGNVFTDSCLAMDVLRCFSDCTFPMFRSHITIRNYAFIPYIVARYLISFYTARSNMTAVRNISVWWIVLKRRYQICIETYYLHKNIYRRLQHLCHISLSSDKCESKLQNSELVAWVRVGTTDTLFTSCRHKMRNSVSKILRIQFWRLFF
jgi:hypothetical protein